MTIARLNEVLDEMRTIYPFEDKETYIQLGDKVTGRWSDLIDIQTKDKKTGITISMSKHAADNYLNEMENCNVIS